MTTNATYSQALTTHTIISRADAIALGQKHYFTGAPCARGHIARRYVKGSKCVDCNTVERTQHRKANPGYATQKWREWMSKHSLDEQVALRASGTEAERIRSITKETNSRAIPLWYEQDKCLTLYIKSIELTKRLGKRFTVDHIIPIKSDTVCGLHCWANLQLLEMKQNSGKYNNYESD